MLALFLDDLWVILLDIAMAFGIVLIILGVLQAFFWKLAFYINLAISFMVTIFLTYITYSIAEPLSEIVPVFNPATITFVVFLSCVLLTLVAAYLGGILAVLEGFVWTSLGILIVSLPSADSISQSILLAAGGGAVVVGIAAYVGSYLDVWLLKTTVGRKMSRSVHAKEEVSASRERGMDVRPSSKMVSYPDYDVLVKKRVLGYILAYKKVKLKTLTSRYKLDVDEIEDIIFEHLADGKVKGLINPKNMTFVVED